MENKINLGAGREIKDGFINHDITRLDGIDVVHDLNVFPWPWDDCSMDYILMQDVLEHLDDIVKPMNELHRILKPGGRVKIESHIGTVGVLMQTPHIKDIFMSIHSIFLM